MDGSSAKKSTSLETLVIQNISNVNDLKAKLGDIIKTGKDYAYDVSTCLTSLLKNCDQEIVLLSVQAISELAKCEEKRASYARKDVIKPILNVLKNDITEGNSEVIKQCCRALGNLCCDCDESRDIILESNGVATLVKLLQNTLQQNSPSQYEIKMFTCKTLLNFAIGDQKYSEAIVQEGVVDPIYKILVSELEKDDMNDEMVSTALLILSVINDNTPEYLFDDHVNSAVLKVLRETANIEISELCLEHLHNQAEHDSVKSLIAKEQGVQLVCSRLEQLVSRHEMGDLNAEDSEVEAVMKQACDLIIIVLTGDEAMQLLYNEATGEVYLTMVRWLDSTNHHLLTTAVLAIGNFARQDKYCIQMMENQIFDKLLDIFETYHKAGVGMERSAQAPRALAAATRAQHGAVAALRNLAVPKENKRAAAARGRAAPALLGALAQVTDPHVAYKLLAAIRMLLDGQESVAVQLATDREALRSVRGWARAGPGGGAGAEAPRLLAWAARLLVRSPRRHWRHLVEEDGCISCLVSMLVVCHTVMQNEAILALTLLAIECLNKTPNSEPEQSTDSPQFDYENSFISQLIAAEIGKHLSVLIETNCAKMPVEVAENLLAFLDITGKKNELAVNYKEAKVPEALQKFMDARNDFSEDMKSSVQCIIATISDNGKKHRLAPRSPPL